MEKIDVELEIRINHIAKNDIWKYLGNWASRSRNMSTCRTDMQSEGLCLASLNDPMSTLLPECMEIVTCLHERDSSSASLEFCTLRNGRTVPDWLISVLIAINTKIWKNKIKNWLCKPLKFHDVTILSQRCANSSDLGGHGTRTRIQISMSFLQFIPIASIVRRDRYQGLRWGHQIHGQPYKTLCEWIMAVVDIPDNVLTAERLNFVKHACYDAIGTRRLHRKLLNLLKQMPWVSWDSSMYD